MDDPDFIIVGAGSAGCVLANRLSADPQTKVLLIEAGPKDGAISLKAPAAMLANLTSTKYNWAFPGAPEPGMRAITSAGSSVAVPAGAGRMFFRIFAARKPMMQAQIPFAVATARSG